MSSTQTLQAGEASDDARGSYGSSKVAEPAKYRLPARYRQNFTKDQLEEQRALALFGEAQMHTRTWNAEERCRKLQEDLEKAIQIGNYNCHVFERADSRIAELEEDNMRLHEENKHLNNGISSMQIDNQELYDDRCDAMDRLEELESQNDELRRALIAMLQYVRRLQNMVPGLFRRIRDSVY